MWKEQVLAELDAMGFRSKIEEEEAFGCKVHVDVVFVEPDFAYSGCWIVGEGFSPETPLRLRATQFLASSSALVFACSLDQLQACVSMRSFSTLIAGACPRLCRTGSYLFPSSSSVMCSPFLFFCGEGNRMDIKNTKEKYRERNRLTFDDLRKDGDGMFDSSFFYKEKKTIIVWVFEPIHSLSIPYSSFKYSWDFF